MKLQNPKTKHRGNLNRQPLLLARRFAIWSLGFVGCLLFGVRCSSSQHI